jgi:hypothetical protein
MKSKKNGTKENVGKWFYFWMKKKEKKKWHYNAENVFFLISVLFCYYFLNKAIKLLKFKKKCEILLEEYNIYVIV